MRSRLATVHSNMIQRCKNPNNPAYKWYGARGISVCKEWESLDNFKDWAMSNGYDESLQLDRINNDLGYEPSNCRWVTCKENCNNRSSCHYVTAFGETRSLMEWSRLLEISYNTLKKRVIDHNEEGEYLLRPSRRKKVIDCG